MLVQKPENQRCDNVEVCPVIETGIGDVGVPSNTAFELIDFCEVSVCQPGKFLGPDFVAHERGCEVPGPVGNTTDQATVVLKMLSAKCIYGRVNGA